MPFLGQLTEVDLNDVANDTRSRTFWRAMRLETIARVVVRSLAALMGLASIAAVSIVGTLSFAGYGTAKLLGKVRPLRDAYQFLPHPYGRTHFRASTCFRETSDSARDRFLSFPVRSQVSAVSKDVQRQTHGSASYPRVLLREIRQILRPLRRVLSRIFLWRPSRTGAHRSCSSPP